MRIFLTLVGLSVLGACAGGLSEEQCLSGDPATYGYEDGRDGLPPSQVEARVAQCDRFEVGFDRARYAQGWADGNALFCTPEGALETALRGQGDILNCRSADYLTEEAFRVGRRYEEAKSDYESAESRYESLISTIRTSRYTIERSRARLPEQTEEKAREKLRKRIDEAFKDLRRAEDDLDYARFELRDAEREFDRAEFDLSRLRAELRSRALDQSRSLDDVLDGQ